jgi:hypothetical protein
MNPANLALTGQATCIAALRRIVRSEGFGHAILLASADKVAVDAVARWCTERIICTAMSSEPCGLCAGCKSLKHQGSLMHYHVALDDRLSYAVDDMRALRSYLALRAGQVGRRVVRIDSVDGCTVAAANALLKVLEEPGLDVTFILTTASPARVLPTIRSRAMLYRLQPVPRSKIEALLAAAGLPKQSIATAIAAAPGQLGTVAAIVESPESTASLRAADVAAEAISTLPLAARFRTLTAFFEGKRDVGEQRQHARTLFAAFARRVASDAWVKARLHRILAGVHDLQTNGQPKLILEAFIT